jgi:rhamnosyltransferase
MNAESFNPAVSVVIRARNEEANLRRLLPILQEQTVPHEVVLVDNASTDGTRQVALEHGATVVDLAKDDFSYPKASNLGVEATSGDHIVMLSAHSFPRRPDWLEVGLSHMDDPDVVGVYSKPITRRDPATSTTDKVFSYLGAAYMRFQPVRRETEFVPSYGQMGSTNAMYRGEQLRENPFDEQRGAGGEDVSWAREMLENGLVIVRDPKFTVYHSHALGPRGWMQQYREWGSVLGDPKPFDRQAIAYRRDE